MCVCGGGGPGAGGGRLYLTLHRDSLNGPALRWAAV